MNIYKDQTTSVEKAMAAVHFLAHVHFLSHNTVVQDADHLKEILIPRGH